MVTQQQADEARAQVEMVELDEKMGRDVVVPGYEAELRRRKVVEEPFVSFQATTTDIIATLRAVIASFHRIPDRDKTRKLWHALDALEEAVLWLEADR